MPDWLQSTFHTDAELSIKTLISRQLIALARARLVDPAILLLDEATSQLDLASEARVQRAMDAAASGRTTILVAHRLPTARQADRIVVIDDGLVAEQGTHDELVARGGVYARLVAAQLGGAVPTNGPTNGSNNGSGHPSTAAHADSQASDVTTAP